MVTLATQTFFEPGARRLLRCLWIGGCIDPRRFRSWLAGLLAVLLTIAPIAQIVPLVASQAAFAASAPIVGSGQEASGGQERALDLLDDWPDAGILPRLLHPEEGLSATTRKALVPKRHASIEPSKPETPSPEDATGTAIHRSSIGTARKPTGPPV
jgi:hypothetical protein